MLKNDGKHALVREKRKRKKVQTERKENTLNNFVVKNIHTMPR